MFHSTPKKGSKRRAEDEEEDQLLGATMDVAEGENSFIQNCSLHVEVDESLLIDDLELSLMEPVPVDAARNKKKKELDLNDCRDLFSSDSDEFSDDEDIVMTDADKDLQAAKEKRKKFLKSEHFQRKNAYNPTNMLSESDVNHLADVTYKRFRLDEDSDNNNVVDADPNP